MTRTSYVIDRRLNGKNKSAVNRRRFMERYRSHIKESVTEAVNRRSITDMEKGEQITIPARDIREPFFHHGKGGDRHVVNPGNKSFRKGDTIERPPQGGKGSGSGDASDRGEGEDDFKFELSTQEFLEFLFEDLELPNLVRKQLVHMDEFTQRRAGFSSTGVPARINILRSLRNAHARRIGMGAGSRKKLRLATARHAELSALTPNSEIINELGELQSEIRRLKARLKALPFLDDIDLRYNRFENVPVASNAAVMFCLMDVSGSMTQTTKDLAKRFFLLLYLFLKRNYEKIELVFIRHHTSAKEVDEQEFFYSRETGGTIVSSALNLTTEVIRQRYPSSGWNIYVAQASDGDNWGHDSPVCANILTQSLLPMVQYYAYIEITDQAHQTLWQHYAQVKEQFGDVFAMEHIRQVTDIYPVFRDLFKQRKVGG